MNEVTSVKPETVSGPPVNPVVWTGQAVLLIDQRRLPESMQVREYASSAAVADAIRDMVVRGAPAIGVTAAYGGALAVAENMHRGELDRDGCMDALEYLAAARPTAVNLHWAVGRIQEGLDVAAPDAYAVATATEIHRWELAASKAMSELGAARLDPGATVLTHCNTGMLATAGWGSAFGVIAEAWRQGRIATVYASETRPWLQGARLTAWEFAQLDIPCQLVVEGASASLMRARQVDWVIVGADRIAANGDVANKVGTFSHAVIARELGARVMVVAPSSTVDFATASGADIVVEERAQEEITAFRGSPIAPPQAGAWNPVFDVTPADYVDLIVTEAAVVERPDRARLAAALGRS